MAFSRLACSIFLSSVSIREFKMTLSTSRAPRTAGFAGQGVCLGTTTVVEVYGTSALQGLLINRALLLWGMARALPLLGAAEWMRLERG
jgi:hypothetical protein